MDKKLFDRLDEFLLKKQDWAEKHPSAKVFNLSSYEDGELRAPVVEVPMQRSYTGHQAIPETMASIPCAYFGLPALLEALNSISGTSKPLSDHGLVFLLQQCIERKYDFGTAYSYLRQRWDTPSTEAKKDLDYCREEDSKRRQGSMDDKGYITNHNLHPRRVWDLYSNRVVPFWFGFKKMDYGNSYSVKLVPISHAWMEKDQRHELQTPVNGSLWPVPIPNDTTLKHVRIELLNYGFEYAWLDVLCLRQKGRADDETLRLHEWRIDVPTIGKVYNINTGFPFNFCYLNGLGRPFEIGDLTSKRHWLNRAWTLQETKVENFIGGLIDSSPRRHQGKQEDEKYMAFEKKLSELEDKIPWVMAPDTCWLLTTMSQRAAESELDKIFGMAYLLQLSAIPTYIVDQDPEEAWERIIPVIPPTTRGDLLFRTPLTGKGRMKWCPSWKQIQQTTFCSWRRDEFCRLDFDESARCYGHSGFRIDGCRLDFQTMELAFILHGENFRYSFLSSGSMPILDGLYTLVASTLRSQRFVLGRIDASGIIEKVTVIDCTITQEDLDRLHNSLKSTRIMYI